MNRVTIPALAKFLLNAVASGDPDGWRFYRRLQRMERFQGDE